MKVFDISVRLSREGGRDSDRLYSPEIQESASREKIAGLGGSVGMVTIEKNVSGGKASKDRQIEKLIKRVEDGESNGIVVYDFTRATREEPWEATMMVGRVVLAGGVVYGCTDNYDSSAPMAAVMTALYAEQASGYLKTMRERSASGQERAKSRGAYIAKTPNGYARSDEGYLIECEASPVVAEVFERKLRGDSYVELAAYWSERVAPITTGGIRKMLTNRVYIGESQSGPSPVIVDPTVFKRVQRMMKTKGPRKPIGQGALTLLQGVAVCWNCGLRLLVYQNRQKLAYYCRGDTPGGCDVRGCINADILDNYVLAEFKQRYRGASISAHSYRDDVAETQKLLDQAREEFGEIKNSTALVSTLGIKGFEELVANAKARLEMAEAAFGDAQAETETFGGITYLLNVWDELPLAVQRRIVARGIERVLVGKGRRPVEAKAKIIFKGDLVVGTPDNTGASLSLVEVSR